ncbi:MAG TPA: pilus assembly protein PilP [Syntrophorhabdaceae bacterium]|jgi:hypothetical protein
MKGTSLVIRCIVIALMLLMVTTGLSYSVEQKGPAPQGVNISDFSYSSENRRNPFEPVNLLRAKQKRDGGEAKSGYELEELRFVGEVKSDNKRFAMMEDMQGKGIMLKKGDFLNKNLWVLDIPPGKVILGYKLKGEIKKIDIDLPKK